MKGRLCHKKKIVLGLTGSFGSGKTTAARIFNSCGAKIIDADKIAHQLLRPGNKIYKEIVSFFGGSILKKDKNINRNRLANIVFNNKSSLKKLNKIIHPEIVKIIKNKIRARNSGIIVLDAPLLIETGLHNIVDRLIVVKINRKKQIERILKKTRLSKTDILKRIKYQISQNAKSRFANFVIDNSGTIGETKKQIIQIRRMLWKN